MQPLERIINVPCKRTESYSILHLAFRNIFFLMDIDISQSDRIVFYSLYGNCKHKNREEPRWRFRSALV